MKRKNDVFFKNHNSKSLIYNSSVPLCLRGGNILQVAYFSFFLLLKELKFKADLVRWRFLNRSYFDYILVLKTLEYFTGANASSQLIFFYNRKIQYFTLKNSGFTLIAQVKFYAFLAPHKIEGKKTQWKIGFELRDSPWFLDEKRYIWRRINEMKICKENLGWKDFFLFWMSFHKY